MGEYAPDDQRDVHSKESAEWREAEAPQDGSAKPADKPQADAGQGEARMGYGNARDADGAMEQDSAEASDTGTAVDGDDARPDVRARADAARPLGGA
ncbi:hypothetical protein J121_1566 [Qipengyuania citrea LAMA 915]|jgi:hypothetical protein|uniref:Uncharacterized protein n=1 Tax=Qipengyuania citrea LAMA 915 TaxID=1306953 RepID=A0A0L1KA95_9SPHN|nr:hypothetical protein [Qipengyuania citrea]KNH00940.1 hypothetical protein J121_1566 [Qipengyuania citrea LAMA 915]